MIFANFLFVFVHVLSMCKQCKPVTTPTYVKSHLITFLFLTKYEQNWSSLLDHVQVITFCNLVHVRSHFLLVHPHNLEIRQGVVVFDRDSIAYRDPIILKVSKESWVS